ncbi:hypothetical protein [Vibrio sp. LaRot3]|uniref:hypothetical protein n=1 Tax=Vibrio sp. LaRot3 TaxID=2998829 RepID=UPI0022CDC7F2|nr:hypothetical protein [Vibrio sp. LaRot3]MDA0150253.1 hypothetical protein [Vibrio sp. LaRot3]
MTKLQQTVEAINAHQCSSIRDEQQTWLEFYQQHNPLYGKVLATKPNTAETQHLLGLTTKAHIEITARVESNQQAAQAMRQALQENVAEHSERFHYQEGDQLRFISHLWLYVQGYLAMDFSLANDHAAHTAQLLSSIESGDEQTFRTELMASFYQGKQQGQADNASHKPNGLFTWLSQLFNR